MTDVTPPPPRIVYDAVRRLHPNQPDERLAVVAKTELNTARLLDNALGNQIKSARWMHWSGRDDHEWLEVSLDDDAWVAQPDLRVIYWEKTGKDSFRRMFKGDEPARFLLADRKARKAISPIGEYTPYADDNSDMGFDLFG